MIYYGISFSFDLIYIDDHFGDLEFEYEDKKYLYDGSFYVSEFVVDNQESEWVEVTDIYLLSALEDCIFDLEEVKNYIENDVESRINELTNKNWIKDYITEL
jgi:hypothetical protein